MCKVKWGRTTIFFEDGVEIRKVEGHRCRECGRMEPEVTFGFKKEGKVKYQHYLCHPCQAEYRKTMNHDPESKRRQMRRGAERRNKKRKLGLSTVSDILKDSKSSDKKSGRQNDQDRKFIENEISHGCSYCGESNIRITLDRIDNSLGHLKSNVRAACMRCNYIRRHMPFDAWIAIVPAIESARKRGLFGLWDGFGERRASSQDGKASACKADQREFDSPLALQDL